MAELVFEPRLSGSRRSLPPHCTGRPLCSIEKAHCTLQSQSGSGDICSLSGICVHRALIFVCRQEHSGTYKPAFLGLPPHWPCFIVSMPVFYILEKSLLSLSFFFFPWLLFKNLVLELRSRVLLTVGRVGKGGGGLGL